MQEQIVPEELRFSFVNLSGLSGQLVLEVHYKVHEGIRRKSREPSKIQPRLVFKSNLSFDRTFIKDAA